MANPKILEIMNWRLLIFILILYSYKVFFVYSLSSKKIWIEFHFLY